MMRSVAVHRSLLGALIALTGVLGCSDEECKKGATECISDSIYRVCIAGEDGNEWLVSQCGDNEVCQSAASEGGGDGTDAGKNASAASDAAGDVCVGTCALDERECVTDSLARFCIAGGIWQLDACDVGERCMDGECSLSSDEGTVQRCVPGTKLCASEQVEKICDPDGTAWIFQGCAANETCTDDACAPDPQSSCDDGNVCLDNKTAVRCLGQDKGFELVACEGETYCENGRCRGPACALGSFCNGTANGLAQIRECVDGTNLRDMTCAAGEVCQQTKDTAQCVPTACVVGTTLCGDPNDPAVDATKFFTSCVIGSNSQIPEWVKGECADALTCDPSTVGSNNPCRQMCTPGAQRCAPVGTATGVNDGYQECDDEGMWGPVMRCNPGVDTRLVCNIKPNDDPAALPEAVCAEPVCNYVVAFPFSGAEGACEGARLRRCNDDGTLSAPENCEMGICRNVDNTVLADGRVAGACDMAVQCQEGEERCVDNGATATPRYQKCVEGLWSTKLDTCAGDNICRDYLDDEGLSRKLCDAECVPSTRRCSGDAVQTCDAKGKWGDANDCKLGTCSALANGDAACTVPCIPKTKRCAGVGALASDGVHSGSAQQQVCGDDGQWGTATDCGAGSVCRTSSSGVELGCVECLGTSVPGGNTEGLADTRCDGADKTQACGADNKWETSVACSGSGLCIGPTPPSCGSCAGPDGTTNLPVCNQTSYRAVPFGCGTCTAADGSTPLATCSQANYVAVPHSCGPCTYTGTATLLPQCTLTNITNAGGTSCADTDTGGTTASSWAGVADCCVGAQLTYADNDPTLTCDPGSWGGVSDCCASAQLTYGDTFPSLSCNPAPWGSEAQCCAAGRQGGSGPSFAYCATP